MEHISFPSINQYRQIVKNIRSGADYFKVPVPKVTYELSVKIHGSNAGICRPVKGNADDVWFQSRERILSIESDNAGFCLFGHGNRDLLNSYIDKIVEVTGAEEGIVQIYGEWFGGNIQKGVGVNGLDKMLCVFGIRISNGPENNNWEPKSTFIEVFGRRLIPDGRIYTKYDFPVWEIEIDFERPELSQNYIVELTEAVEKDCPVARFFKPDSTENLIGEGVVGTPIYDASHGFDVRGNVYKSKGELHSVSKVKTTAKLDSEKMTSQTEFVEKTLTDNRLNQFYDKMIEIGHPIDMTTTGIFIKAVSSDIFREEADTMVASLIEPKDVMGIIAQKAKKFWTDKVNAA